MKHIYYLHPTPDSLLYECFDIITWTDWIALEVIPTPDLIVLTEVFYFPN